ncbi:hypothetical protein FHS96_004681 [Sphingomonas zeicaulis]|uniref:hypothetical protein n=1 Tax=Sphingomonas zeicaulis TaxID=1632740 RepID=UPI003D1EE8EF
MDLFGHQFRYRTIVFIYPFGICYNQGGGVGSALFIIAASPTSGSSITLNLPICGLQATSPDEGFLEWGLEYRIDRSYLSLTLNETVYATVRQTIIDKLGDRPKYLVADINLPRLAGES